MTTEQLVSRLLSAVEGGFPFELPSRWRGKAWWFLLAYLTAKVAGADGGFVNFESPQVHPVDLNPGGDVLAICNTPAAAIQLFDLRGSLPTMTRSIPVGLDPTSVRFRTDSELWVANYISDTICVVDLERGCVVRTLPTFDEPADIVFAGNPVRAFVSCSQANSVLVFDPEQLSRAPTVVPIKGQRPRSLAVSPDGRTVYVALFESGNGTTLLGGGSEEAFGKPFPPNVVSDRRGPYGDQARVNPPPNAGMGFDPPLNPTNRPPPKSGLIIRQDSAGVWRDENGKDWSRFVTGEWAPLSGRVPGWRLIDHDLARIDTTSLEVSYVGGLMNLCMALAVNPVTGSVSVVGTDAKNEVRFEPVLNGTFLRVLLATVAPGTWATPQVADLNPHLTYRTNRIAPALRAQSLGDPRGMAWSTNGARALVTGMGSDNVVLLDATGRRRPGQSIPVGEGPTGVAIDEKRQCAYVLNRFGSSLSVVSLVSESEVGRVAFFDPTPAAVRRGRKHLYSTHLGSGLGHVACASCHVDARMDRLAWDLGNPAGKMKAVKGGNLGAGVHGLDTGFEDYHPMKGPMLTQTLQDILGKEPFHWRGDRRSLEEFNDTFLELQAADRALTTEEMDDFKALLASIHFPPNPYRNPDNTLPTRVELAGHYTTGRFGPAGRSLPPGNARLGLAIFQDAERRIDRQAFACATCHTLPTGLGTDAVLVSRSRAKESMFAALPPGPAGEHHHALVGINFSVQHNFKVPHLRNLYQRTGFEMSQTESLAGFGFVHDGGIDSLARLVSHDVFDVRSDSEVAHLVAFMLAFSGSDLPPPAVASRDGSLLPPGPSSQDAPAALGRQYTTHGALADREAVEELIGLAERAGAELIAFSAVDGLPCGWEYQTPRFVCKSSGRSLALQELVGIGHERAPVTFLIVPHVTKPGDLSSATSEGALP